jgi:broad specificity phosphatase PhoE
MDLYLVRHGQSLANADLTDDLDSTLTPLGQRQAELTAMRLQNEGLTRIYVSPLRRTLQTATPIAKSTGLSAELYPEICEYFSTRHPEYYQFQGLAPEQIQAQFPFVASNSEFPCEHPWWPQTLEDYTNVYQRAKGVRDMLLKKFARTDEKILIVSHAETVGRLIEAFLRQPPDPAGAPWSDNCGLSRLHCPPELISPSTVVFTNETSHLATKETS